MWPVPLRSVMKMRRPLHQVEVQESGPSTAVQIQLLVVAALRHQVNPDSSSTVAVGMDAA